jgi:serine-type D-Ala-D-Ala endopeptidase (penicillin-binding protein 7)
VWTVKNQKRISRAGVSPWLFSCSSFLVRTGRSLYLAPYLALFLAFALVLTTQSSLAKTAEVTKKTTKAVASKSHSKTSQKAGGAKSGKLALNQRATTSKSAALAKHAKSQTKSSRATSGAKKLALAAPKGRPGTRTSAGTKLTKAQRQAEIKAALKASVRSKIATRHVGRLQRVNQVARVIEPAKPSLGQAIGLHSVEDPLGLRSSVALVADAQTGQVLYEKNGGVVLPIASITKLMTAMVVLDSKANLQASLEVTEEDRDEERNSRSRLPMGSRLTRLELLNLALMASENRAASALGRYHPGGESGFVGEMNAKARALGLVDTAFTESTGLSSANVSTARDLAKLVQAASRYPLIRELSTAPELTVDTGVRQITFRNTNRLVGAESWGVQLQKTGYISEAGQCLVMMARWAERPVIMIFLDSAGRHSRLGDAQRVREWLDSGGSATRVKTQG